MFTPLSAVWCLVAILAAAPAPLHARSAKKPAKSAAPAKSFDLDGLAAQAALDRAGFSPGLVDGSPGRKTTLALREFQKAHDLPQSGECDAATRAALHMDGTEPLVEYQVTAADRRDVGPVPKDWNAKAALDRLRYESLTALLAERGHCTKATVQRLNPGVALENLKPGSKIKLPNVHAATPRGHAARLEVDLGEKLIRAVDEHGRTIAFFHCSIAKFAEKRPSGSAKVTSVAFDPVYLFRPEMWPEVHSVKRKLTIPAGPRNPVGLCWIGLSLPGYGMHGSPTPELIGKTGSHGCFRLTNWDAIRLGKLVRVGTPVRFSGP